METIVVFQLREQFEIQVNQGLMLPLRQNNK